MKHLLGADNNFLSLNDFRCKYGIDPRPLSFYGLISAVKSLRTDLQSKKATPLIYKKLISNKSLTPGSSQKKWLKDCGLPINDNINWTAGYLLAKKMHKEH